jgi:carboxylesterase type B
MAEESTENDDRALTLRGQSKGFGKIAAALGLARANDANEAFNRALRRRPAEEQSTIRAEENGRLDRLARAVTADENRSKEEVDKRLRAIERLRRRLMKD